MNTMSPMPSQGCQIPTRSLSDMLNEIDSNLEATTRTLAEMISVLTGEDVPYPYNEKLDGNVHKMGQLERIDSLAIASARIRTAADRLLEKVL